MSENPGQVAESRGGRGWLVILTALLALSITAAVCIFIGLEQRKAREQIFAAMARDINLRLQTSIVTEHGIRGLRGMVLAVGGMERLTAEQFRTFARSRNLKREFPGTRGLVLVTRLPRENQQAALADLRKRGWALTQLQALGPAKGDKLVVLGAEPIELNNRTIGLDLNSEPKRAEAARRAFRTGEATLSAPVTLVNTADAGVLMMLPIYDGQTPIAEDDRVAAASGLAMMPIRIKDRMALFPWPKEKVEIELADVTDPSKPVRFYSSGSGASNGNLVEVRDMQLYGRTWRVTMRATPALNSSLPFAPLPLVAAVGLLASLFAVLVAAALDRNHSKIQKLNQELEEQASVRSAELAAARESALASSLHFRTIFDKNPLGIALVSGDGTEIQQSNDKFREFFGRPNAFLSACGWTQPAFRGERPAYNTIDYIRPDGTPIWARLTLSPVLHEVGAPVDRLILMAEDITLEHEQKLQLEEVLARLSLATETARIGIWYWSFDDDSVQWDARMFELFGRPPDEEASPHLSYDFWAVCLHPEDREATEDTLLRAKEVDEPWEANYRIVCANGEVRDIEAFAMQRRNADGVAIGMLGVCRDITMRLQLEADLVAARVEAEAANLAKDQFLANISHELRTPMNAILGLLDVLEGTRLDSVQRDYFRSVHNAAQALLRILNDILDFSRFQSGKLEIVPENFNMEDLFARLGDLFAIPANEKGVELVLDLEEGASGRFCGDVLRLGQVLNNLVDNAIKFTDAGTIVVAASRVASEAQGSERIRFEVRDTGIGLTEGQMQTLFQPFVQADQSLTRTCGGSGLGLSICRQLASAMDGEVGVESSPGAGSTFWFEVPLPNASEVAAETASLARERVLVIEDHADARRVLLSILDKWEFESDASPSAELALELILGEAQKDNPFTLLLLDWKLPRNDGLWLLSELHRASRDGKLSRIPTILMVTAFDRTMLKRSAHKMALAPDAVLTKPVTASQLYNVIADLQQQGCTDRREVSPELSGVSMESEARSVRGARLLLVEDNFTNQQVALAMLVQLGMVVDTASNGEDALRKLEEGDYDLVLMDIHMPVMNGLEAAQAIRNGRWGEGLPIVAMTAAAFPEDRRKVAAAGMNDFLSKPINPQRLAAVLLRWLPSKEGQPEPELELLPVTEASRGMPDHMVHFDLPATLARFAGDSALLLRVITAFGEDFQHWEGDARAAVGARDLGRLKSLTHTLKGGAGGVGAFEVEASSAALEKLLHETDRWPRGPGLAKLVDACCCKLHDAIAELDGKSPLPDHD